MNRTFKTLLLWLIMIALPMQATAAVIGASCSSGHPTMQEQDFVSYRVTPTHGQAHGHDAFSVHGDHGAMHAHHGQHNHAHAQSDFTGELSSATDMAGVDAHMQHDGHSTCSACAACCIGAVAPPSAHVKTPHFTVFTTRSTVSSKFLAGFIPAGLERPPRSFLA